MGEWRCRETGETLVAARLISERKTECERGDKYGRIAFANTMYFEAIQWIYDAVRYILPQPALKQPDTITRLKNGRIREVETVSVNGTIGYMYGRIAFANTMYLFLRIVTRQ